MSEHYNNDPKEKQQKRKGQILFVLMSFAAVIIVASIAFFILSKIKTSQSNDALTQDQFEGTAEVSSQLQAECQSSAAKITQLKELELIEIEFRKNAENCKDVYFGLENDSSFRKEGMYADLVVDIANLISKTDNVKAIELLKFAKNIKSWEFYLGPVSCDSQQVLEAYIESFSNNEEKQCIKAADLKSKFFPDLIAKNFSVFSKLVSKNNVVWLGVPESDVGCPETIASITQTLKKITTGQVSIDESQIENKDGNNINLGIKLSDKENVTLILSTKEECLQLSSVLIPNLEVSE